MEDVNHVNMVNENETAYCKKMGKIVTFDGPFVAKTCWTCPLWAGLSEGYGVECVWDDPNANAQTMKYTKPQAALSEAGDKVSDLNSIASKAGVAALQARLAMKSGEDKNAGNEDGSDQEEPMSDDDMQNVMSSVDSSGGDQGAAPAQKAPPAKKGQVPPQFQKKAPPAAAAPAGNQAPPAKKKGQVPPQFQKKAPPVAQ